MSAPDEQMLPPQQEQPPPPQQQHANDGDDDDDEPRLTADDIDEVIDDTRGDEPMEEEDSGPDDDDEAGDGEGAAADARQQQQQQPDGETFEDTSIAAFYSHRKSLFALALHPAFAQTGLALSGGEDDGAWIWHTHDGADVARLDGHTDSVTAVGWSADGTLAASGGMDGRVRVWAQPQPGAAWALVQSLEGPDEVVWLAWHPKGNVLVAGASDSTVWMWQLPSGNVMNVFSGHTAAVTAGRWTPDGKKLVTVSEDGTLIVWDPRSGSPLGKLQTGDARFHFDAGITALAVSSDSRVLLVGGAEGDVRVVNIGSLDAGGAPAVVGELRGHAAGESIEAAEFVDLLGAGPSAAPTHAITASTEGKAVVWDLASGKMRCETMHDAAITTLSLHAASPLFTTASADHTARTWDARTGALIATHKGFTDGILALAVGADDGFTQGADTGGIGAYQAAQAGQRKGYKIVCAGDEGVALVFRV